MNLDDLRALKEFFPVECVNCGYCCSRAPCVWGVANEDGSCAYLTEPDEIGRQFCSHYEEISKHPSSWSCPSFGAGCSSSLGNLKRIELVLKLRDLHQDQQPRPKIKNVEEGT